MMDGREETMQQRRDARRAQAQETRTEDSPVHDQSDAGATVVERLERTAPPRRRLRPLLPAAELAIACGAVLGASARFTVSTLAHPFAPAGLPLGTLAVNLVGCLLIGLMQTLFLDLIRVRREIQLFVSVGILGGLTTFSSVSVETVRLIQDGGLATAAAYQITSLVGGILAALLGITLAQRVYRRFGGGGEQ